MWGTGVRTWAGAGLTALALLAATTVVAAPASAASAVHYVTSVSNSGTGSLRQAILDANANSGADTIYFSIAGTGMHTIQPTSALPAITDSVLLDGTYQTGYSGMPRVQIDGTSAGASNGIELNASNSTIKGLAVDNFALAGIEVNGDNDAIQANYLGVAPDGTTSAGNAGDGVEVSSSAGGDTIGGTGAGVANLIEDNGGAGVEVATAASGVSIRGNGIDGNGGLGILLDSGGNGDQAAASVTTASRDGTSTYVTGALASGPSVTYDVDFYASAACDGSGSGEGRYFLGSTAVSTDGAGNGTYSLLLTRAAPASSQITATATAPVGSTSEFSACTTVTNRGQIVTVANYAFTPSIAKIAQGQTVEWDFQGPASHTATDTTGMGLYSSGPMGPGEMFSHEFDYAGTFTFHCALHPLLMMGAAKVPILATKGIYGRTTVTWASAAPTVGFVFDVQVKKPGVKGWHPWKAGTTLETAPYTPKGSGTYRFRARLRETSNGKASGWSPAASVKV